MSSCALHLRADESLVVTVAFGSSEYPQREECVYLGPASDHRFHLVRRTSGDTARVHDTQILTAFGQVKGAAAGAPAARYPLGRWTSTAGRGF